MLVNTTQKSLALRQPANDVALTPTARLQSAVNSLATASAEQAAQIRHFQDKLGHLKAAVDRLHRSCEAYNAALRRLDVARLHRRAKRLARIAGNWQHVGR